MEVISFYWPNILAGSILVFVLGLFGAHLIARNKSMEIMLLGQEFQTGILLSSLLLPLIENGGHGEHGFHLETFSSLVIALGLHSLYHRLLARHRSFRVEAALGFIILLMGISHIVVKLSPLVEFHMVKSFLGDIVTVSKMESITVSVIAVILAGVLIKYRVPILKDTIELAIFNRTTHERRVRKIFLVATILLMMFSVHLFGNIFTVGAIIIPAFVASLFSVPLKRFSLMMGVNTLSVPLAFALLMYNEQLPTTVVIIFILTFLSVLSAKFIQKWG